MKICIGLKEKLFLGGTALFFLAVYLWFPLTTPEIFNSPDETANYFFIQRQAVGGDFFSPEPLNYFLSDALRPRSISWNGYALVPQGFIGLLLVYGWFAKIFGLAAIKFFTPLLAILGALAFYGIVKKIFGARAAAISYFLLLFFPAYWYYASRFLYPNAPFVSMLLIAVWAAMNHALYSDGKIRHLIVFSVSFIAALAIRPVEILWVLPLTVMVFLFYKENFSWHRFFYFALIMAFVAIPVLANNLFLYGSILGSGYTLRRTIEIGAGGDANFARCAICAISPYGLHWRATIDNINLIFIKKLWWFSFAAILGVLAASFVGKKKEIRIYFAIASLASAWLLIYYGSGIFADNPNGTVTLGDSHFRYWLPVFIFMLPFVGLAADKIIFRLRLLVRAVALSAVFIFFAAASVYSVFFLPDDGLLAVKKNLEKNYAVKEAVLKITAPDDIIITARQDKIFFPERRVIYAPKISNPQLLDDLQKIKNRNFYYYGIGPAAEEFYAMDNIARIYGFRLVRVAIFGKEVLYKLERIDEGFTYLK